MRGDLGLLSQVTRNLADNAARHAKTTVRLGVTQAAGGAVLTVEDDGAGIPAADRDRVFERFVRLDEARARDAGGSGLGLAIVREIVRAHGGDVRVDAVASGGARFVVVAAALTDLTRFRLASGVARDRGVLPRRTPCASPSSGSRASPEPPF